MKTINDAVKKYQSLNQQCQKLQQRSNQLRQQHKTLQEQQRELHNQMHSLKTLIDYCIISNQSPAQASLSNTFEQIAEAVSDHNSQIIGDTIYLDRNLGSINPHSLASVGSLSIDTSNHDWLSTVSTVDIRNP